MRPTAQPSRLASAPGCLQTLGDRHHGVPAPAPRGAPSYEAGEPSCKVTLSSMQLLWLPWCMATDGAAGSSPSVSSPCTSEVSVGPSRLESSCPQGPAPSGGSRGRNLLPRLFQPQRRPHPLARGPFLHLQIQQHSSCQSLPQLLSSHLSLTLSPLHPPPPRRPLWLH